MKTLRLKIFIAAVSVLLLSVAVIYGLGLYLPSSIVLRSGESSVISIGLPVSGKFVCEGTAVSAVNDEPVKDNITVNLSKPIKIMTQNEGLAHLDLSFCGIPIKSSTIKVLSDRELVPCGQAVGLELDTDGVLVLGTGEVRTEGGQYVSPCARILKSGDLIQGVGEKRITDKESLVDYVEKSNTAELPLTVCRNGETMVINVSPVVSVESGKKKLGVWVRDSTKGIGTITCYDKNGNFYALGHPVTDVDTGELMQIRQGKIMPTTITEVQRGQKGSPGELVGSTENEIKLGSVFANTYRGIQGRFSKLPSTSTSKSGMCKIALKSEVQKGKATILATTDSSGVKEYEIEIESLTTLSSDSSKAMIIRITDERLLNKTGGIVRGMSGAPILQNGRLVGAVTHVFVQDPTRGYGIYIEDML